MERRDHYRSDWHRYNLKRKVAVLPPVSAEGFKQRELGMFAAVDCSRAIPEHPHTTVTLGISAQQVKTQADVERAQFSAECVACGKTYFTHNAYQNHLQSSKHKECMATYEKCH